VGLRAQLAQAEESAARANETHASLLDRINHLQAEMSEYRGGLEEARDLRRQLEEAQAAAQVERAERDMAIRAAQDLERFIEVERETAEAALARLREDVQALLETARKRGPVDTSELERLQAELADAKQLSAAFRLQMEQDRAAFDLEVAAVRGENAQLREMNERAISEQGRAATALEQLNTKFRTSEFELDKERKQNLMLVAEMEALRNEAAAQVAQANLYAGEMEGRITRLREALDLALIRGRSAAAHAEALSSAFLQASEALAAAREDLANIEITQEFTEGDGDGGNGQAQGSLFDAAPFIRDLAALPGTFDAPRAEVAPTPGGGDRPLHELIEEVLSGEGPAQP
jgi:chromosome segregation ATPase